MDLNIVTVVVVVLAVVILFQLRSVLGRRTGHERPPFDPYSRPAKPEGETPERTVGSLPSQTAAIDEFADIDEIAPQGSVLNKNLRAIRGVDASFTPASFCEGVRAAYEMVMGAFASGDRQTLQNLLTREVFDEFSAVIDERNERGESVQFSFITISSLEIVGANLQDGIAEITLSLCSEIISATYDEKQQLVDGDPQAVVEIHDRWTFIRDTQSDDPNWLLAATDDDQETE